ncbi:putative amidoligase enzyme-domain-containing protein [Thermothelomyces heterothallicus CBS 202.75]|uniref:putative amidoligase enzyme-domain-containing protein n=1 Tax=Thermothelomyces heterothallicus CBS 202.75 TaxID=1149848 RepID=UPI003742FC1C
MAGSQTFDQPGLRFGVEIELVVKKPSHGNLPYLEKSRIPSHVACLSQKADVTESYQKWIVIKNSTLPSNPAENLFGVELVSSIFYTQQRHKWIPELRETWRVLESGFEVHATKECSTHVHLSPASGPWTLSAARGVAKAAIFFERCIDGLMPGHRRIINPYCMSNRLADLGERMCWCSRDSVHARQTLHQDDFVHPHFRWNLTALTESRTRTIEFRQPPASRNARDTLAWILFAACFTRWASERADAAFNPAEMPEIADLYRYVRAGAHVSVVPDDILALLEGLFRSAKPLPAPRHDLKGTTEEEMDELKTEAKRKGMSLEKYNKALFAYMSKGK